MKPEELYKEIVTFCKSNTNQDLIKKYSRYFKEGMYDAYGLPQHLMQNKIKEILDRDYADYELIRKTSKLLVRSSKFEEVSFAILFYKSFINEASRKTFDDINIWFETGINNWAHCDGICGELMFPLLKKDIINFLDFKTWITSKNKYQRRAVPVSLIKVLKSTDNFLPFFILIEPLMADSEREVHQGVGWFLREAWKKQKEQTESFLLKWKDISPRLIFQYSCEKMSREEKLKFKRTK
jgi:3-methyladenine DNA glycosylase AlkD